MLLLMNATETKTKFEVTRVKAQRSTQFTIFVYVLSPLK